MGERIEFQAGEQTCQGYLARPASGEGPGVLLLHAWWGLNDFFRGFADRLAAEGFVVLAPDLYGGEIARTVAEAEVLSGKPQPVPHREQILAARLHLLGLAGLVSSRFGAVGCSMGAFNSIWLTTAHPDHLAAVVAFYDAHEGPFDRSEAAYQFHFAANDPYVDNDYRGLMAHQLREAGRPAEYFDYPDTGHWFIESDRPDAYVPAAADLAWSRTVEFLRRELA